MTTIKITGHNAEVFRYNFTSIVAILQSIAMSGYRPTDYESERLNLGLQATREGNKIDLYPRVNNYWLYIESETETEAICRLVFRYSKNGVKEAACCTMLAAMFDFVEILN
jgi:hypothetical protein